MLQCLFEGSDLFLQCVSLSAEPPQTEASKMTLKTQYLSCNLKLGRPASPAEGGGRRSI